MRVKQDTKPYYFSPYFFEYCLRVRFALQIWARNNIDSSEVSSLDLAGACKIGSCLVVRKLMEHGYHPKLINGYFKGLSHYWVGVEDVFIDITATQFGLDKPPIYISSCKSPHYKTRCSHSEEARLFIPEELEIRKIIDECY